MPPPSIQPFQVLLTGFEPWGKLPINASFQAAKELEGEILSSPPSDLINDTISTRSNSHSKLHIPIHIKTQEIPVSYSTVLSITPPFHNLPPSTTTSTLEYATSLNSAASHPHVTNHYDLIVHVGVGYPGAVKLEGVARKFSYDKLDGGLKLAQGEVGHRGFLGQDWAKSKEVLFTRINRDTVLRWCHSRGIQSIEKSDDAGLYLCEFIYYCSLASAKRVESQSGRESKSALPVLFVHVPPENMPYKISQLSQILRLIIWGIVNEGGLIEEEKVIDS